MKLPSLRRALAVLVPIGLLAAAFLAWWLLSWSPFPLPPQVQTPTARYGLRAALPHMRTEAGGAAVGGKFYIVGGIDALARTLTSFMAYDPAADAWTRLPDYPAQINHPGVVGARGKLWVVGGFGPLGIRLRGFMFARWDPQTRVSVYDPASGQWQAGPPMPEPRGAGGVCATEDALWYVGGIRADLEVAPDLFRLDLETGVWEKKAPMTVARDHMRMEAVGGALYAISGRKDDLRKNLTVVERYDIATDTWSRVADIPRGRGGFGSAVLGGKIYTFGGEYVWTCLTNVEEYDPVADRWRTLAALPEGRHGICAATLGDRIHLVSGGRHPRISISGIHRTFQPGGGGDG